MTTFRKDIAGLRAVAVLLVVLYHCGFDRQIRGGFIGVDVFFVLSGYLITRILHNEAIAGTFSIWNFYERRIRRILPAIIVVYIAVLVASFALLMPGETAQQARNALSSMAFVSNIYFYLKFDYFDASSEFNALLHTWSLSVEEQFYIFFPPLFIALHNRFPRWVKPTVVGIAVLTLGLSQLRIGADSSAVFYLVHYRAWELMIGSILAIGVIPLSSNRIVINVAAGLGIAMIAASALLLTRSSQFPGIAALPTCLGTAMIIWAGTNRETLVGRMLGLRPAIFIGDISYSLYLWHWPVWVFGNQIHEPKTVVERLAFIGVAIVLATLSYFLVEQPFRKKQTGVSARKVVYTGVASLASLAVVAVALPAASVSYWQIPPRVEAVADFINYRADRNFRAGDCFLTSSNEFRMFKFEKCLSLSDSKPNYLLFGDSHAAHFYPGLADGLGVNLLQATASGCRPVDGATGELRCRQLFEYIVKDYLPKHKIDAVIISARWQDGDLPALKREIEKIKRYVPKVIVFGPIAEYDKALPRVLANSLYYNDPTIVDEHRVPGRKALDQAMEQQIPSTGAEYISVYKTLCPQGTCTLWTADDMPIQSDYGHLTNAGSHEIVNRMRPKLVGVSAAPQPEKTI